MFLGQTARGSAENLMVLPAGLEPATSGLENRCSIQLSYGSLGALSLFLGALQGNPILLALLTQIPIANGSPKK